MFIFVHKNRFQGGRFKFTFGQFSFEHVNSITYRIKLGTASLLVRVGNNYFVSYCLVKTSTHFIFYANDVRASLILIFFELFIYFFW